MTGLRAYLDYNATAPMRPEALAAMTDALASWGNASSVHGEGRVARKRVERARAQVARLLGVATGEVIFTGSGTEAANTVVGAGWDAIVLSGLEHAAIRDPATASGAALHSVPVLPDGTADVAAFKSKLDEVCDGAEQQRVLVAIQAANNETGVIQPVHDIAGHAHLLGARVLCDAVQMAGRVSLSRDQLDADYVIVSAHKMGGPQGVGALIVRDGQSLRPLVRGGGQELRRRAGTENVAGIAGFGAAAEAAMQDFGRFSRLAELRARLEAELADITPSAVVVAGDSPRLANTSAVALPGRRAETMLIALDMAGVSLSAGAACSSGKVGHSHVLEAMGLDDELAKATVRISLGHATSEADIDLLVAAWTQFGERQDETRHVA